MNTTLSQTSPSSGAPTFLERFLHFLTRLVRPLSDEAPL